jgi:hypothetical protein
MLTDIMGGILSPILKIIDRIVLELLKQENQETLDEIKAQMAMIVAEASSQDPWTSRARPTFLYVIYGVILFCIVGGVMGIWWHDAMERAAANINALLRAIPDQLWNLFGVGYLGYTGARSLDKWKAKS